MLVLVIRSSARLSISPSILQLLGELADVAEIDRIQRLNVCAYTFGLLTPPLAITENLIDVVSVES